MLAHSSLKARLPKAAKEQPGLPGLQSASQVYAIVRLVVFLLLLYIALVIHFPLFRAAREAPRQPVPLQLSVTFNLQWAS